VESNLGKRDITSIPFSKKGCDVVDFINKSSARTEVTLRSLVEELSRESGYGRNEIIKQLKIAEDQKKIRLVEARPFKTLGAYAFSPYSSWFLLAIIATILSLGLLLVTSGVVLYLRYIFGSALVLFLPGYSLTEALYAKRKDLDDLTKVALSFGLSLAVIPLMGLILNYNPLGLQLVPLAGSLCAFTLILLTIALFRKYSYYKLSKLAEL
jgi:hypothetical protein